MCLLPRERPPKNRCSGQPAFALLKIDDYYHLAGQGEMSLLTVMEGIPGGVGIEFDPSCLDVQLRPTLFD